MDSDKNHNSTEQKIFKSCRSDQDLIILSFPTLKAENKILV